MWIKKKEIEQLSEFVKGYSSGEELDIRVNREGSFNILKNDIYALVNTKNEQIKAVETERDSPYSLEYPVPRRNYSLSQTPTTVLSLFS